MSKLKSKKAIKTAKPKAKPQAVAKLSKSAEQKKLGAKKAEKEKKLEAVAELPPGAQVGPQIGEDGEEIDLEEQAAEAGASRAAAGGPPVGGAEVSVTFKNFRHHPDMENFYRFIFENDLRFEALELVSKKLIEKQLEKQHGYEEKLKKKGKSASR